MDRIAHRLLHPRLAAGRNWGSTASKADSTSLALAAMACGSWSATACFKLSDTIYAPRIWPRF